MQLSLYGLSILVLGSLLRSRPIPKDMRLQLITLCFAALCVRTEAQTDPSATYNKADSLYRAGDLREALTQYEGLEGALDKADTLYPYALWYHAMTLWNLESEHRGSNDWPSALKYALDFEKVLDRSVGHLSEEELSKKYWMFKNIVVAYFALDQVDKARIYQDKLYQAYAEKKLPDGLDRFYNFEKFVWEDKNVWGYEWFEELPKDRFNRSFSKVIYYVYSTNPDGSDKDQLFRFHVLMFHNIDPSNKVDYVLTKRLEKAKDEVSGTLYAYTYSSPIDIGKLRRDIREVLKGNYQPDTKTTIRKN